MIIERLNRQEYLYARTRMTAFAETMGDPSAIEFVEGSGWWATLAKVPVPLFNRIVLSARVEPSELEAVMMRFQERGAVPTFETSPGSLTPELGVWLAKRGFVGSAQYPIFSCPVRDGLSGAGNEQVSQVECRRVQSPADLESFAEVYVKAWSIYEGIVATMKANIRRWPNLDGWNLYLAVDSSGRPSAVAVLFVNDGVGYLADAATLASARGQGAQRALLAARIAEAQRLKLELIYSRADFGSTSHRNMERAGLQLAFVRTSFSKLI